MSKFRRIVSRRRRPTEIPTIRVAIRNPRMERDPYGAAEAARCTVPAPCGRQPRLRHSIAPDAPYRAIRLHGKALRPVSTLDAPEAHLGVSHRPTRAVLGAR